jgi:hypothetical protein
MMSSMAELQLRLAKDRIEREIAAAARLRQARHPAPSIRQAIGLRFIAIGARLAAEPSLTSVRSR